MSYTANYTDEHGNTTTVSISEEESREALRNDYEALIKIYNPRYVRIERKRAQEGEALHLAITVKAPSHYLIDNNDKTPKACQSMTAEIIAFPGYPLMSVRAFYAPDHYLASPNVFRSGGACIDRWVVFTSSLLTVAEKLIMDMIHNPVVTRYDSMANPTLEEWHKAGVARGEFPTIRPQLLYAPAVPLPERRQRTVKTPPPLPRRRT